MIRFTARLVMLVSVLLSTAGCDGGGSEAQNGCSVGTLHGTYIYAQDGFSIAGGTASQRTPFAQAGREIFSDGTMSGVATANVDGAVVRVTYVGTYAVQSDCTGAVTFTDTDGAASHHDIAIEDGGAEFGFVQTAVNVAPAAFERRRTASGAACSLASLKGTYVYAGDGFGRSAVVVVQLVPVG
jgi:hypothetical protein